MRKYFALLPDLLLGRLKEGRLKSGFLLSRSIGELNQLQLRKHSGTKAAIYSLNILLVFVAGKS